MPSSCGFFSQLNCGYFYLQKYKIEVQLLYIFYWPFVQTPRTQKMCRKPFCHPSYKKKPLKNYFPKPEKKAPSFLLQTNTYLVGHFYFIEVLQRCSFASNSLYGKISFFIKFCISNFPSFHKKNNLTKNSIFLLCALNMNPYAMIVTHCEHFAKSEDHKNMQENILLTFLSKLSTVFQI